jgi:hypothetical protein
MSFRTGLFAAAAAVIVLQPVAASAQQACVTEEEVSAIAIYSMPSLVEGVRVRCNGQLAPNGFLSRQNNSLKARYAALQAKAWPRAKSGLLKVLATKSSATQGAQGLDMIGNLPDNAVRPLVDALIVQEVSPKIETGQCGRIERIIELASPIDPEVAGNLLGAVVGLVNPKELPVCSPRRV